eukprot:m.25626 g.25626  ORF g.25626 m.25626 type:complete len:282 (-) comp8743_c1_seq1:551-1396(-)
MPCYAGLNTENGHQCTVMHFQTVCNTRHFDCSCNGHARLYFDVNTCVCVCAPVSVYSEYNELAFADLVSNALVKSVTYAVIAVEPLSPIGRFGLAAQNSLVLVGGAYLHKKIAQVFPRYPLLAFLCTSTILSVVRSHSMLARCMGMSVLELFLWRMRGVSYLIQDTWNALKNRWQNQRATWRSYVLEAPVEFDVPEEMEDAIPKSLCCPIGHTFMNDPVVCNGFIFDRAFIEVWLQERNVCPLTQKPLGTRRVVPCLTMKSLLLEFADAHNIPYSLVPPGD